MKYLFDFFFNDTATTEIYTLSLHDALPISAGESFCRRGAHVICSEVLDEARSRESRDEGQRQGGEHEARHDVAHPARSEEHTSELQSRQYLVCRLLLEKKKKTYYLSYRILP